MNCKIHFIFIIEFQRCNMTLFKLMIVSAVILFISSQVNAADADIYTIEDVSSSAGLVLGK